jgi:hypothetical protein
VAAPSSGLARRPRALPAASAASELAPAAANSGTATVTKSPSFRSRAVPATSRSPPRAHVRTLPGQTPGGSALPSTPWRTWPARSSAPGSPTDALAPTTVARTAPASSASPRPRVCGLNVPRQHRAAPTSFVPAARRRAVAAAWATSDSRPACRCWGRLRLLFDDTAFRRVGQPATTTTATRSGRRGRLAQRQRSAGLRLLSCMEGASGGALTTS